MSAARCVDRRGSTCAWTEREHVTRLGQEGRTQWAGDRHSAHRIGRYTRIREPVDDPKDPWEMPVYRSSPYPLLALSDSVWLITQKIRQSHQRRSCRLLHHRDLTLKLINSRRQPLAHRPSWPLASARRATKVPLELSERKALVWGSGGAFAIHSKAEV